MTRDFGYADQSAFSAFTTEQLAVDINYELAVPLDYWQKNAYIIPEDVSRRVNQLKHFLQLYQGDYSLYEEGLNVRVNVHKLVAIFMADALASFPPQFTFEGDEVDLPPRFIQTLQNSLYCALVDHIRFGTSLLMVENSDYGPVVKAPMPIYWYPADKGADVLVTKNGKEIELYINEPPGVLVHERWSNIDDDAQTTGSAGTLKERLSQEMEMVGTEAGWDVIQRWGTGRATTMLNIPRRPETGDWGNPLYLDITHLAVELSRRLSQNSLILTEHGWPREVLLPNIDEAFGETLDALLDQKPNSEDATVAVDWMTQQTRLGQWRKSTIGALSRKYRDIKYLQWTGRLNDHFNQIDEVKQDLYVQTSVPPALYGDGMSNFPASGEALKKQFVRTYLYLKQLQATFLSEIRKSVLIGAMFDGAGASRLEDLAEGMVIGWPNVFDIDQEQGESVLDENVGTEGEESREATEGGRADRSPVNQMNGSNGNV